MSGSTEPIGFEPSHAETEPNVYTEPIVTEVQFNDIVSKYGNFDWHGLRSGSPSEFAQVVQFLSFSRINSVPHEEFTKLDVYGAGFAEALLADINRHHADSSTASSLQTHSTPNTSIYPASTMGNTSSQSLAPSHDCFHVDHQALAGASVSTAIEIEEDDSPGSQTVPTAVSTKPKGSCTYYCIFGKCKSLSASPSSFATYERHENAHWHRFPCIGCLENEHERTQILKSINAHCDTFETDQFVFFLEKYRRENSNLGQDTIRLWIRKGGLKKHLIDDHGMDPHDAQNLTSKWVVEMKQLTACGICEDAPVLRGCQEAALHMWREHWQKGHTMLQWSNDRVVDKLLQVRGDVLLIVQSFIESAFPNIPRPVMTWDRSGISKLRTELENGRLTADELAHLAIQNMIVQQRLTSMNSTNGSKATSIPDELFPDVGDDLLFDSADSFIASEGQHTPLSTNAVNEEFDNVSRSICLRQAQHHNGFAYESVESKADEKPERDAVVAAAQSQIQGQVTYNPYEAVSEPSGTKKPSGYLDASQSSVNPSASYNSANLTRSRERMPVDGDHSGTAKPAASKPAYKGYSQRTGGPGKTKRPRSPGSNVDGAQPKPAPYPANTMRDRAVEKFRGFSLNRH